MVSEDGDYNEVVDSVVTVRKCRSQTHFLKDSSGAFMPAKKADGLEMVVTITRKRRVGDAGAVL